MSIENITTLRSIIQNSTLIADVEISPIAGKTTSELCELITTKPQDSFFYLAMTGSVYTLFKDVPEVPTWFDEIADPNIRSRGLVGTFLGMRVVSDVDSESKLDASQFEDVAVLYEIANSPSVDAFFSGKPIVGSEQTPSVKTYSKCMRLMIASDSKEYHERLQAHLDAFKG